MPPLSPHPLALFSFEPINEGLRMVANHPENKHVVSTLLNRVCVLNIGHVRSKVNKNTIATFGRGDTADVFVDGPSISRVQCSPEIDPESSVMMLYDRSYGSFTQVFGKHAMQIEHPRPRKVVVQDDRNIYSGMGGDKCILVQFISCR